MTGITQDDILALKMCIYGLVQATRQYRKKVVKILKSIGFIGGDAERCLFCRKTNKGVCFVVLYVDDNLLVGQQVAIDDEIR